jgi:hypothetical protein
MKSPPGKLCNEKFSGKDRPTASGQAKTSQLKKGGRTADRKVYRSDEEVNSKR